MEWTRLIVQDTSSQLPVKLAKYLSVNPFVNIKKISEHFEVAYTTAQRAVVLLENRKILTQIGDSKRDRVYCASGILKALEKD